MWRAADVMLMVADVMLMAPGGIGRRLSEGDVMGRNGI
jgi:hypothetical protein